MLVPYRSRLAYPAGAKPGFSPTHIAATNCRFSAVATANGTAVNLLTGLKGANTGGSSTIDGRVGPARVFGAASARIQFAGGAAVLDGALTMAVIGVIVSFSSGCYIQASTGTTPSCIVGGNGTAQIFVGGVGGTVITLTPSPTITTGTAYFIVTSYTAAGGISLVMRNLSNGVISTATSASAVTLVASNGTYVLGDSAQGISPGFNCAAGMVSGVRLGPVELLAWANDPWSFWYPTKDRVQFTGQLAASNIYYQKRRFVIWR